MNQSQLYTNRQVNKTIHILRHSSQQNQKPILKIIHSLKPKYGKLIQCVIVPFQKLHDQNILPQLKIRQKSVEATCSIYMYSECKHRTYNTMTTNNNLLAAPENENLHEGFLTALGGELCPILSCA